MNIAVFPGSFDPITAGHFDIVSRAIPLFDKIIIAVGTNASKNYMFSQVQRVQWIKDTFEHEASVEVDAYEGLTVEYCRQKKAGFILRGLRNSTDFEFEKAIAQMNRQLDNTLETVFLMTSAGLSSISSSIVRDIIRNGGDHSPFVPGAVKIKARPL